MKKFWGIFCSVLAVALAVVIGVGSSGFRNWNLTEWFNRWGKGTEQPEPDDSPVVDLGMIGEGMIIPAESGTEEDDVQFLSALLPRSAYAANAVAESAEKAYNVTATVLPDNEADNTAVEWSISWKSTSSWVYVNGIYKEVSDYVMIATSAESAEASKTVSVSCMQSFGEPIILTATCKNAPQISNSIQIDYAARFNLNMGYYGTGNSNQDMEGIVPKIGLSNNTDSEVTFEFGDVDKYHSLFPYSLMYTINGDYTIADTYQFALKLSSGDSFFKTIDFESLGYHFDAFFDHVQDFGEFTIEKSANGTWYNIVNLPYTGGEGARFAMTVNGVGQLLSRSGSQGFTSTLKNDIDNGEYTRKAASDSLKSVLTSNNGRIPLCVMTLTVTGSRSSYSYSTKVYITKVLYSTNISGVEINGGNVVT